MEDKESLIAKVRALEAEVAHLIERWRLNDEVDALYDQVYRELLLFMIQDPQTIQRATWLLWTAHDLERIAPRMRDEFGAESPVLWLRGDICRTDLAMEIDGVFAAV